MKRKMGKKKTKTRKQALIKTKQKKHNHKNQAKHGKNIYFFVKNSTHLIPISSV